MLAYERMTEEEELRLVHKAVEMEMRELDAGMIKTYSFEEVKRRRRTRAAKWNQIKQIQA